MLLTIIPIALQLLLVLHVIRTGQDRFWIYLLVFLPVVGGLAYLIVVVLPELRHSRATGIVANSLSKAINPTKRLKELERSLSLSNTVANKLALADECLACGDALKAETLYRDCLQGLFRGDRNISLKLARALVGLDRHQEALDILEFLAAAAPLERVDDQLLMILCQERTGLALAEVGERLRSLFAGSRNLEVGYHLCRCQLARDQAEAADDTVKQMEALLQHHPHFRTTMGKEWLKAAKKLV